jgi:hypothetical protein
MNTKMRGQRIVEVPEIEGNLPCQFFGKGTCPGCYSEPLYRIRRVKVKGTARTPARGLLRAGVWREWTPDDWKRFKSMYPSRRYFLVTRGLWEKAHYEQLLQDTYCVNVQVSTWYIGGTFSPDIELLRWLLSVSQKTVIRLVSSKETAHAYGELVERLGMWWRFMETPWREPHGPKTYGTKTPLEAAGVRVGIRCNTSCEDCIGENGFLGCAVTAEFLKRIPSLPQFTPTRHEPEERIRFEWSRLTTEALEMLGGEASLQELYAKVQELEPRVSTNHLWQVRIRSRIQELATNVGRGRWRRNQT